MSVIYITHDLGVVANVADRVAVMYAGQIVEVGKVDEIFYDARHPYTWALLSALPQLGVKGEALPTIDGTPPNLFNKIKVMHLHLETDRHWLLILRKSSIF